MWPFKRKEPERNYQQEALDALLAFRKPGESFNYLGVRMLVYSVKREYFGCGLWLARMSTNYLDGRGEIQQLHFHASDLAAMKAENT